MGLVSGESVVRPPADFAELRTGHDEFNHPANLMTVRFELAEHFGKKRFVRELHAPAKGVAQQLPAELAFKIVRALAEDGLPQSAKAVDLGAVG